ncbi:MAG: VOC family protein [Candidatus Rokubacteria bacterium]|nr:VOC family protein [Candidatus Rokubacteria bacterium]
MKVESMYHTGFTVSDIARSIEFYRDILGLTLYKRQQGTAEYLSTITGFENVKLEVAFLTTPDGSGMLELLQYVSHPAPPTGRETNRPGNAHLCFKVSEIHEACVALRRRGVRLISDPAEITAGVHKGGYGVYLRDPDGLTIELFQPPSTAGG